MIVALAAVFLLVFLAAGFEMAVLAAAVFALLYVVWAGKP